MKKMGKTYDIAIDLRGDFQLILAARIARIPFLSGRGSTGLGFLLDIDVPNFKNKHLVESNLFLLEKTGLGEFPFRNPKIKISQNFRKPVREVPVHSTTLSLGGNFI